MPNEIIIKHGTPLVWAHTAYSSSISGFERTNQINLNGVATVEARQGEKASLEHIYSEFKFSGRFIVSVGIEFAVAPVSLTTVDFYWAGSPSPTPGNANPGGISGADADYTGTASDSLTDSVPQLQYMGSLIATADATTVVQYQTIGTLEVFLHYGMPVVVNNTAQSFVSDAVEMYVALIPLIDEVQ